MRGAGKYLRLYYRCHVIHPPRERLDAHCTADSFRACKLARKVHRIIRGFDGTPSQIGLTETRRSCPNGTEWRRCLLRLLLGLGARRYHTEE